MASSAGMLEDTSAESNVENGSPDHILEKNNEFFRHCNKGLSLVTASLL